MGLKLKFEKIFIKDNTDRVKKTESEIIQQAEEIALKVSEESYNGNVIASLINQTSTTIKLKARNIEFEGLVTANSNFKILSDGSIEAVNAKLSGSITATKMIAPINPIYYGEIGVSDGTIGLGLFDTSFNSKPYMKISKTVKGFRMSDVNNIGRISFDDDDSRIRDHNGKTRIYITDYSTAIYSPNGNTVLHVRDAYVNIIKDGVVIGNWG